MLSPAGVVGVELSATELVVEKCLVVVGTPLHTHWN